MKYTCLLLLPLFFWACKEPPLHEAAEACITDSFTLKGIESASELFYLNPLNDSTLYSYNRSAGTAQLYHKDDHSAYKLVVNKQLTGFADQISASFQYNPEKKLFYHVDGANRTIEMLDLDFNRVYKQRLQHRLPYLGDNYELSGSKGWPMIFSGDTLWMAQFNNSLDEYSNYCREQPLITMVCTPDSIAYAGSLFHFPKDFAAYFTPNSLYCYRDNTIYLMYPRCDTIYTYNRLTGQEGKIAIHNKAFVPPSKFDFSTMGTAGYVKATTKHYLFNFHYFDICFNEKTQHFVLFYKVPDKPGPKGELPTYEEQALHALVLDKNFNTVKYVRFKAMGYVYPFCALLLPDRGLAIPKYSTTIPNDKAVTFYIFDL
jgi:hypothetical protein